MTAISELQAWIFWPAVLAVCAAFSAMYSGLETGIYVINKGRLDLHAEAGDPSARLIQRMLANPNRLLAVLLIGNGVMNYMAAFAVSAMFVQAGYEHRAEWYTLLVATPLMFVIGESVPKITFQRLADRSVYRMAWLLRWSDAAFRITGLAPLVQLVAGALLKLSGADRRGAAPLAGHGQVASVVAEGQASGVLTHSQSNMADRVMHLAEVTVADVMIPMRSVVTLRRGAGRLELIGLIRAHNYSRLPVLDKTGKVEGILNIYDVLTAEAGEAIEEKITAPLILPAGLPASEALYRLRQRREAMAVVTRGEKHVGIVTIKDLVEEIVGELGEW